ncbi:MAG: rhomboid family intramembrane serine protease [Treponema sp.]|jgi:membrane associated rhomboid family serine protease|nr:rhomboid family intramembrane serine protease [Treponema sp.]
MNSIIRRPFKYSNNGAVYWLIGINILVFLAMRYLGRDILIFLSEKMPMRPYRIVNDGWVWTFVTYMFMHDIRGLSHIFFNMFGLFIFGIHVERQMGSREFLLYYFVTGTLAGILSFGAYYITGNYGIALFGASGAVFAVELAYAVIFPDSIIYIWGIIPLRAPVMVLGFTALELFFSLTGVRANIAHLTHLAGFAFGWIYFLIRFGMNPWKQLTRRN